MDLINIKPTSALVRFQSGEHYNFGVDIVEGIATDITQVADALPSYNVYKTRVEHEGILFKLSPESEETVEIAALNKWRIADWRLMLRILEYYADNRVEGLQKAAKHLLHVLRTYRGLTELNLFAKTGYIRDAIDALHEPSAQPAVALIPGFLPLMNELEAFNTELDGLYLKREQDNGLVHGLGTLGDYRRQVDRTFLDFVGDLNSAYRRNELGAKNPALKASIEKVANTITSLFDKMLDILAHREGSGKKNPQKPDITNPEVPGEGGEGGGDGGDGGDGNGDGYETPDISNPPPFGE